MNTPHSSHTPLLTVDDLAVSFDTGQQHRVQAVNGVRMTIFPRQTLAVVGESGCGKSVTALTTLRLIPTPPGRIDRGRILFQQRDGRTTNVLDLDQHAMRSIRGRDIAMIFQEPMTSLNPVFTIGDQIIEAILIHQHVSRKQATDIAINAMHEVGIVNPAQRLRAYPHQFSGGMRQRVMIAMALACQPRLLLADEPTTALDVTIQAQILDLLAELKTSRGLGIMFITHDLGIVAERADVVCVMYAGRVVEYASVDALFSRRLHPYTRGLLACIPSLDSPKDRLQTIAQTMADEANFAPITIANEPLRPWWPAHQPPSPTCRPRLHEVSPQHWVTFWSDSQSPEPLPSIAPAEPAPC